MSNGERLALDVRFWGKEHGLPGLYPLICHLLDSAAVFLVLWDEVLSEGMRRRIAAELGLSVAEARLVTGFWAGLHDLGKITPPFVVKVPEAFKVVDGDAMYGGSAGAAEERGFRHEMGTHWSLVSLLAKEGGYGFEGRVAGALAHQVAQLLGGHHGCFGEVIARRKAVDPGAYQAGLGGAGWAEQRRLHFGEVRRVVGGGVVPPGGLSAEVAVVVHGLVVFADWLASGAGWIVPRMPGVGWSGSAAELDAHWAAACAGAPALVRGARLGRVGFPEGEAGRFERLFPFAPNALQQDVAEVLPGLVGEQGSGLVLVTAPTGDGKTEAALAAAVALGRASGARGLFFALPTMATADAMFGRVAEFAGRALVGERALMLLHSGAWLSSVMDPAGVVGGVDRWRIGEAVPDEGAEVAEVAEAGVFSGGSVTAVEADGWLRSGARRGLGAALGAGTVDQVLAGVVPGRYSSLRLFSVADKVVVVDEAHAYGPWMQALMVRWLEWLGAFGAPVVLLSATLSGRVAGELVEAYRRGAGFGEPVGVEPVYPGWLFVDVASGEVRGPRAVASGRERVLDVEVRPVRWETGVGERIVAGGRRAALREVLAPVAREGGVALVCCSTVAEAQATFRDLRVAFPELAGREGGVRLLHSRFPGVLRAEVTEGCEAAYGKPAAGEVPGARAGSILVATQIVEQSLDLDFDLVVSDLAPLAQLLQRAGRGRRHARRGGRPGWARAEDRPALVVLEPVDEEGVTAPPRSWGDVYDHGLLVRTAALLRARCGEGIAVPGDVQGLVDAVYAEDFVDRLVQASEREVEGLRERLARLDQRREGAVAAEQSLAWLAGVCAPADVHGDWSRLSRSAVEGAEELLTTRLGADSGRVLCLFEQDGGPASLDEEGLLPVPAGRGGAVVKRVVRRLVPVPGRWMPSAGERDALPEGWQKVPLLRDIAAVSMRRAGMERGECRWVGELAGRRVQFTTSIGFERI
ncbi:CRISPR-associated endonuclease Cas3'' [Streptomyces albidoflavus]|uniref:CRISPR-associated endonuclease Cas3'' n=1 Tax=Streptomyces albidoflavus TaxID=1886 RepID=UPI00352C6BDC|nr:CRISPR-associated endonuclease Cas3'' [Streptomyces albidoflavus]WSD57072.1 CRISPR-associated endonuclease Cas3'' [Streptomyces albidoflavus]